VPTLRWCHLGRVEYDAARALQNRLAALRATGACGDLLLLLEHAPVVTVGRNGTVPPGMDVAVVRTDRGGNATYHGPGQLVGYPVVKLGAAGRGVRDFVTRLERALCGTAARCGVHAYARAGLPGVWTGDAAAARKLASIGLAVRRGVTLHGCALNVDARAERGFRDFDPCGLPGVRVASLATVAASPAPPIETVAEMLAYELAAALGVSPERCAPADLPASPPADHSFASAPSSVPAEVISRHGHQPAS